MAKAKHQAVVLLDGVPNVVFEGFEVPDNDPVVAANPDLFELDKPRRKRPPPVEER